MDSYPKTWLRFVYPTFCICLVGVVILAERYSFSLSNLFRFIAVPVLFTLVLLSYSKILQTIILIFSRASIESAADFSLWQYDENIVYLYRVYTTMVRCGTAQHGTVRNGYRVTFTRVCGYVV